MTSEENIMQVDDGFATESITKSTALTVSNVSGANPDGRGHSPGESSSGLHQNMNFLRITKQEMPDNDFTSVNHQSPQQQQQHSSQADTKIKTEFLAGATSSFEPSQMDFSETATPNVSWFDHGGESKTPKGNGYLQGGHEPLPNQSSSIGTLQKMMQRFDDSSTAFHPSHETVSPKFSGFPFNHFRSPFRGQNVSPGVSSPSTSTQPIKSSTPYFTANNSFTSPGEESSRQPKLYPCKKCPFMSNCKEELDEHLNTHYKASCNQCNYRATTQGRLARHIDIAHRDEAKEAKEGDPTLQQKKINKSKNDETEDSSNNSSDETGNAHGSDYSKVLKKPKGCKHCGLYFSTKNDFYDHILVHFPDASKCPETGCKFVTRLAHHMRYHMLRHRGIKNFSCPECKYSCATKSMLISHAKAHDTVSRYRCANCNFSAKHANALNTHLRKTGHTAGPVLSSDGSIPFNDPSSNFENHVRKKARTESKPVKKSTTQDISENFSSRSPLPGSVPYSPVNSLQMPQLSLMQRYLGLQMMSSLMQRGGGSSLVAPPSWTSPLELMKYQMRNISCLQCGEAFSSRHQLMAHLYTTQCGTGPPFGLPPKQEQNAGNNEDCLNDSNGNNLRMDDEDHENVETSTLNPEEDAAIRRASSSFNENFRPWPNGGTRWLGQDKDSSEMFFSPERAVIKGESNYHNSDSFSRDNRSYNKNIHNNSSNNNKNSTINHNHNNNSNNNNINNNNNNNNGSNGESTADEDHQLEVSCEPLDLSMKKPSEETLNRSDRRDEDLKRNRKSRRKGIAYKVDIAALNDAEDCPSRNDENYCDKRIIPCNLTFESYDSDDRNRPGSIDSESSPPLLPVSNPAPMPSRSNGTSQLPDLEPIARHHHHHQQQQQRFSPKNISGSFCRHCGVVFNDERMFSTHMLLHSPGQPLLCHLCQRTSESGRDFFLHLSEYEHNFKSELHSSEKR